MVINFINMVINGFSVLNEVHLREHIKDLRMLDKKTFDNFLRLLNFFEGKK